MSSIPAVLASVLPVPFVRGTPVGDGREDFDFLFGTWRIANRKLTDALDPDCTEWLEFATTGTAHPILDGLGNIDSVVAPSDGPLAGFQGFTLRLFEPGQRLWRIWWSSTNRPGVLDEPMEGRFTDGTGVFHGVDTIAGQRIDVRFNWTPGASAARWSQDFSRDGGATWWTTWIMDFTRAG
jgi:hypothetical protein